MAKAIFWVDFCKGWYLIDICFEFLVIIIHLYNLDVIFIILFNKNKVQYMHHVTD